MKKIRSKLYNVLAFSFSSQTALFLFCEILLGVLLITLATFAFADIAKGTLFDQQVIRLDTDISHFVYTLRTSLLTNIMIFISFLGADFTLGLATIFVILLAWKKHKKESLLFAVMLVFGLILNGILKEIFQRPRPTFDPLLTLSSYSFPSGHAMNAFVFYALLAYFTFHFTKNLTISLLAIGGASLLIFLIGLSRVYLGVHYPSDVLAGYVAGLLWFVLVLVVERTLVYVKLYKKYRGKKR